MKVVTTIFFIAAMAMAGLSSLPAHAKYASMVIDADSGRILHQVNADTRNYPASLTKIMTLYMVFDALKRGDVKVTDTWVVSATAAQQRADSSKLGLKAGSKISVKDAILALVTKSANDAAEVIAEALGGTEENFARMMTDRAREIGMSRTTFKNASGMPHPRNLSTARDMALLGLRIREDFPGYYDYFSTTHFKFAGKTYRNHNNLLSSYEGTDGIKTGYIRASGFNLVASVERNGHRLIGVVFGGESAKSRDRHMRKLLDKAFAKIEQSPSFAPLLVASAEADAQGTPAVAPVPQGDAAPAVDLTEMQATQWTIQVGAFSRAEAARMIAQQAATRLGALAEGVVAIVDSTGKFHRSRLAGFGKQAAYDACRALERQNVDCIVFAPRS